MIEIKLNPPHFKELIKKGLSLDVIYLLLMVKNGLDVGEELGDFPKMNSIGQSTIRKGLITEGGKITTDGEELLKFLSFTDGTPKIVKKKVDQDAFVAFWSHFPGTDEFTYKGRTFAGERALRAKKPDCKVKFEAIIKEGEYTAEEIIEALKLEVQQKKEASLKGGENKLKYLQNSLTWLRQRGFENYIELVRQGKRAKEETNLTSPVGAGISI